MLVLIPQCKIGYINWIYMTATVCLYIVLPCLVFLSIKVMYVCITSLQLLVIWREWRQQTSLERQRTEREQRRAQLANLSLRASQLQLELTEVDFIHTQALIGQIKKPYF